MEFSAKTEHWMETGTTIGTAVLAWENAATAKYAAANPQGYSLFSMQRFGDALAGIIGHDLTFQIFGGKWGGKADFKPNIFGAINKTSVSGGIILAVDAILKEVFPEYRKLDGVPAIVKGAGLGITIGGVVGGIFDPNGGSTSYGSPSGFQNVPNARGGQQQSVVALV
jgi:hypothetical protein